MNISISISIDINTSIITISSSLLLTEFTIINLSSLFPD